MTPPKTIQALAFRDGTVLWAKDGTRYVMTHVAPLSCTLRRTEHKVRGKRARKDERRRRRELLAGGRRGGKSLGLDLASGPDRSVELRRDVETGDVLEGRER